MRITNKDVVQSYILTTAKYDFSVHEKRVLYRIVEMLQQYTQGLKLNNKYAVNKTLFGDWDLQIPIADLLKGEEDHNHMMVKKALDSLNKKTIAYEDERRWQSFNLIERPAIEKYDCIATLRLAPEIAEVFLNFSKGFSKYELATAMSFESVYAMRFYELLSEQKKPITYDIQKLKIMLCIENKYERVNGFVDKVLEAAKKELDEKSPYSFLYKMNKRGRSFTSVTFYPVAQPQNRDHRIDDRKKQNQSSLRWELDKLTITYLKEQYLFTDAEIRNNIDVFKEANEKIDLLYELSALKRKCADKMNPKGYLINALKKMLLPS